jgi:hypothetical protein
MTMPESVCYNPRCTNLMNPDFGIYICSYWGGKINPKEVEKCSAKDKKLEDYNDQRLDFFNLP